jgi:hypothetical protein
LQNLLATISDVFYFTFKANHVEQFGKRGKPINNIDISRLFCFDLYFLYRPKSLGMGVFSRNAAFLGAKSTIFYDLLTISGFLLKI